MRLCCKTTKLSSSIDKDWWIKTICKGSGRVRHLSVYVQLGQLGGIMGWSSFCTSKVETPQESWHPFYLQHLNTQTHSHWSEQQSYNLQHMHVLGPYMPNWHQRTSCIEKAALEHHKNYSWQPTSLYVLFLCERKYLSADIQTIIMIKQHSIIAASNQKWLCYGRGETYRERYGETAQNWCNHGYYSDTL